MSVSYYRNAILTDAKNLWQGFSFTGSNSKLAIKTGLSCVISLMIAYYFEFNQAYWCCITCTIMQLPTVGSVIKKGIVRSLATLVGAVSAVLIFGLFPLEPICYNISIFSVAVICYYNSAKAKNDYFWYLLIITFMIIYTVGFQLEDPHDIIYSAFYRGLEILLGVLVSFVVSITVWPHHATNDFFAKIIKLRNDTKLYIQTVFEQYMSLKYDKKAPTEQYQNLKKQISALLALSQDVKLEKKVKKPILCKIASEHEKLQDYIEVIHNFYHTISHTCTAKYQLNYSKQLRKILSAIDEVTKYSEENKDSSLVHFKTQLEELFNSTKAKYEKMYRQGKTFNYTVTDVALFNESVLILSNFFDIYLNIVLDDKQNVTSAPKKAIPKKEQFGYDEYSLLWFNFYLHTPSLKYALKTSVMLLTAIWAFMLLEMPSDISGLNLSVAIMTICIPDPIASKIKGILRLSGCIIGAILGLIFVGLDINTTVIMLGCMFAVVYVAGYIKSGGPNISYAGLQISLAYFFTTLSTKGFGQVDDTVEIVNRLISIFFGVIFALFFKSFLWKDNHFLCLKKNIREFWKKFNTANIRSGTGLYSEVLTSGVNSIKGEITNLAITSKVGKEDLLKLKELSDYTERLALAAKALSSYSKETVSFVYDIDPELFNDFDTLLAEFHFSMDEKELNRYAERIANMRSKFEYFKFTIRKNGLVRSKSMEFKQSYSHYIVSSIRVVNRLKDIVQTQRELQPFLTVKA